MADEPLQPKRISRPSSPKSKAQQREYARLAQQRSRAKRRDEEAALESSLTRVDAALLRERERLDDLQQSNGTLRARAIAASNELSQLRVVLGDGPPSPSADASKSERLHFKARVETAPHSRAPPKRSCGLLADQTERMSAHFVEICGRRVREAAAGGSRLEALVAFRSAAAQRLGCSVGEVQWLYRAEHFPDLVDDGALHTDIRTPGCLVKNNVGWLVMHIHTFALYAICKRLKEQRTGLAKADADLGDQALFSPAPLPPTIAAPAPTAVTAAQLPGRVDPPAGARDSAPGGEDSADSGATWGPGAPGVGRDADGACHGMRHLRAVLHSALALRAPAAVDAAAAPAPRTEAQLATLVRRVLARALTELLPRLHPADAVRMLRRLEAHFAPPPRSGGDRRGEGGPLSVPLQMFNLTSAAAHDVIRAALADVCASPQTPALPTTVESVDGALAAAESALEEIRGESDLIGFLMTVDAPRLTYGMFQGLRPAGLGADTYDAMNTSAYVAMDLGQTQKAALSCAWSAYQAAVKDVRRAHDACLSQLCTLCPAAGAQAAAGVSEASAHKPDHPSAPPASALQQLERLALAVEPMAPQRVAAEAESPPALEQLAPVVDEQPAKCDARQGVDARASVAAEQIPQRPGGGGPPEGAPLSRVRGFCVSTAIPPALAQASVEHKRGGGPPDRHGWTRNLLGASPRATEAAAAGVRTCCSCGTSCASPSWSA